MVRPEILDHDYTAAELEGRTRRELACDNCKGRSCGHKGMRIVEGRSMRVCLLDTDARRIFGADNEQYIEGQAYKLCL